MSVCEDAAAAAVRIRVRDELWHGDVGPRDCLEQTPLANFCE